MLSSWIFKCPQKLAYLALGFFWGTESDSYFPFFNWFIFVAVGQWFGDKYQFLQNIFKGLTSEIFMGHRPIFDAIICLPINLGLISLFYFIGQLIPQKSIPVLIHPLCKYR